LEASKISLAIPVASSSEIPGSRCVMSCSFGKTRIQLTSKDVASVPRRKYDIDYIGVNRGAPGNAQRFRPWRGAIADEPAAAHAHEAPGQDSEATAMRAASVRRWHLVQTIAPLAHNTHR
jgi:hypothetical protein